MQTLNSQFKQMLELSEQLGLAELHLAVKEDFVRNAPAVVIRRTDCSCGGVIFFSNPRQLSEADCNTVISLMSANLIKALYNQGCFGPSQNWFAELVWTRYAQQRQLRIISGTHELYWNHLRNLMQFRCM